MDSLGTTNILLGIMAAVSVLEGLLLLAVGFGAWKVYRNVTELVGGIEERHIAPTVARVHHMLDDVQSVTATVKGETQRVDHVLHRTIDRVDDTARWMRSNVVARTSRLVGFVRGARVAIETLLEDHDRHLPMKVRT